MGTLTDQPADTADSLDPERRAATGLGGVIAKQFRAVARVCVHLSELYVPDPFLLAIILTFVAAAIARCFTDSSADQILDAWYRGLWDITPFAMQMALILCTGVALARSPIIKWALCGLAGLPNGQTAAAIIVFLTAAACCWINRGFGLVVGALLSREIAEESPQRRFQLPCRCRLHGFHGLGLWPVEFDCLGHRDTRECPQLC